MSEAWKHAFDSINAGAGSAGSAKTAQSPNRRQAHQERRRQTIVESLFLLWTETIQAIGRYEMVAYISEAENSSNNGEGASLRLKDNDTGKNVDHPITKILADIDNKIAAMSQSSTAL